MVLLVCVPFVFAYLVATRLLREKHLWMCVVLAYSLGLFLYLFSVNIFFHFVPLKTAVYMTVILMIAGSVAIFLVKPVRVRRQNLAVTEAIWLSFLCITAFIVALLWQMKYSDDDYWIHVPLMALYLKDNFPPVNPFFPHLPYKGHYGRDLTIASLSLFFGGKFLLVQYLLTAFNQAAIFAVGYLTSKKYLRSYPQAMLAMAFAFLAVNGAKPGLLEVFKNNNSFVYLLLFLDVYLYFVAITRRDISSKIIAIVAFAVYGIVYETHYGILLIAISALPILMSILRRRWKPRYFTITAVIVTGSLMIALVQGGTLTDVAKRYFMRATDHGIKTEDIRAASQEIEIRFPKKDFRITSYLGDEFNVFSGRLAKEGGFFILFLPLVIPLMVYRKNYWAIVFSLFSVLAIAIPASVDFGRFNPESLRFLFFGGMAAALVFGTTVGMIHESISRTIRIDKKLMLVLYGCLLAAPFGKSAERAIQLLRDAAAQPENFFFSPETWACGSEASQSKVRRGRVCDAVDLNVAKHIEPIIQRGDIMLTNLYASSDRAIINGHAAISSFSGAYIVGMGIKFSKNLNFSIGDNYVKQSGFRAIAFWNTIDTNLLREMNVKYLYVIPDNMPPLLYKQLREENGLKLIHREIDATGLEPREVYRVQGEPSARNYFMPSDLRFRSATMPKIFQAEHFYQIPVTFSSMDTGFKNELKIYYRILYQGRQVNQGDEIRQTINLEKRGPDEYTGMLYFVAPYEEGAYELEFYTLDTTGYKVLLDESHKKVLLRIDVT